MRDDATKQPASAEERAARRARRAARSEGADKPKRTAEERAARRASRAGNDAEKSVGTVAEKAERRARRAEQAGSGATPRRTPEERAERRAARAAKAAGKAPSRKGTREERQARRAARAAEGRSGKRTPRLKLERLYQDDDIAISRMGDPNASRVVLCFAGIGAGGIAEGKNKVALGGLQPAEFVGTSLIEDASVLHIADIKRSWFNGFEPERILDILRPLVEGKRLITLGNSMGGFGAVWITKLLPVEIAIAFVPQFSVNPEIVPGERRWREWTSKITEWRTKSLADSFVPETRYFTFNGDGDKLHWEHFRPQPNAHHYVIDGAGHQAAERMKSAGVLSDVVRACASGGDPLPAMRAGGLSVHEIGA